MRGVITGRDIVVHLRVILTEFGVGCAYRCLRAAVRGEQTTFLDLALKGARC